MREKERETMSQDNHRQGDFFCLSLFLPTLPTYSSRLYWPLFITENAVNHLRSCVFLLQPVQRSTLDVNQPVRFSLKIKLNFLKPQSVHLTSSTIVLRTQNLKTASSTPISVPGT